MGIRQSVARFCLLALRPLSRTPDVKDWWEVVQIVVTSLGIVIGPTLKLVQAKLSEVLSDIFMVVLPSSIVAILFFVAGVRLQLKVTRLTTPRLTVAQGKEFQAPDGYIYLTLVVSNPTAKPIPSVYGNLVHARNLYETPQAREFIAQYPQAEVRQGLPPDTHKYPWSWIKGGRLETLPPHPSRRSLYILAFKEGESAFYTPTEDGIGYRCYIPGDIELLIDVGTEALDIPPTRVRAVFSVNGRATWKILEIINP